MYSEVDDNLAAALPDEDATVSIDAFQLAFEFCILKNIHTNNITLEITKRPRSCAALFK